MLRNAPRNAFRKATAGLQRRLLPAEGQPPVWGPWWGRPVGRVLDHGIYNTRVHGKELVPGRGGVIFAANHLSYLDGPVMVGAAPRYMHVLVKNEMFKGFLGSVLTASGQISIDRAGDRQALQRAKHVLGSGGCIGILPEGTRGQGAASSVSSGVAWLALNSAAPVVPVALLGTRHPGEHKDKIPPLRRKIHVSFGEPTRIEREPGTSGRVSMDTAAERIRALLAGHVRSAIERTGQPLPEDETDQLSANPIEGKDS